MSFMFDSNSTVAEGRWRLRSPEDFKKESFRRWSTWAGVKAPSGVSFLVGDLQAKPSKALQAIRFNKQLWSEKAASKYWESLKDKPGFEKKWSWVSAKTAAVGDEEVFLEEPFIEEAPTLDKIKLKIKNLVAQKYYEKALELIHFYGLDVPKLVEQLKGLSKGSVTGRSKAQEVMLEGSDLAKEEALEWFKNHSDANEIIKALKDPNPEIQWVAVKHLYELHNVIGLEKALGSANSKVKESAYLALIGLGYLEHVKEELKGNEAARRHAVTNIFKTQTDHLLFYLWKHHLPNETSASLREEIYAVFADLAKFKNPEYWKVVAQGRDDTDKNVRETVIGLLFRGGVLEQLKVEDRRKKKEELESEDFKELRRSIIWQYHNYLLQPFEKGVERDYAEASLDSIIMALPTDFELEWAPYGSAFFDRKKLAEKYRAALEKYVAEYMKGTGEWLKKHKEDQSREERLKALKDKALEEEASLEKETVQPSTSWSIHTPWNYDAALPLGPKDDNFTLKDVHQFYGRPFGKFKNNLNLLFKKKKKLPLAAMDVTTVCKVCGERWESCACPSGGKQLGLK